MLPSERSRLSVSSPMVPKSHWVTPDPVPIAMSFAAASKSIVMLSLFAPFAAMIVRMPSAADSNDCQDAVSGRYRNIGIIGIGSTFIES